VSSQSENGLKAMPTGNLKLVGELKESTLKIETYFNRAPRNTLEKRTRQPVIIK